MERLDLHVEVVAQGDEKGWIVLLGQIATINRFDIVHLLPSPLSCAYPNAVSASKAMAAIVCDKNVVFISDDIFLQR